MKKQTLVSAAVAATMMPIFGLGGLASADTNQYIQVDGGSSSCYIYSSSGIPSYSSACDTSYGSYDASTKTITLGSGINSTDISIYTAIDGPVTITSNADVTLRHISIDKTMTSGVTLAFGTHSYTGAMPVAENITIKNGNYHILDTSYYDDTNIVIDGGNIDFTDRTTTVFDNIRINGGTISSSAWFSARSDLLMYGGSIEGKNMAAGNKLVVNNGEINLAIGGLSGDDIEISGGKISIANYEIFAISSSASNGSIIINGGELNLEAGATGTTALSSSGSDIEINDGQITVTNYTNAAITGNNVTINGGETVLNANPKGGTAVRASSKIEINGGKITATNLGFGLGANDGITINGGDTNLKGLGAEAGFGIFTHATGGGDFKIIGGNLTLDNFEWGINLQEAKAYFNGGTTTIKNSQIHTIWIDPATDPENDIVFGDDMGIKENTYVFYDNKGTGIADPNAVTITKGYTYRRHYGYEVIENPNTVSSETTTKTITKSSVPKTPDTGVFSGANNAILIAVSAGLVTVLSVAGSFAAYALYRRSRKVKFDR